MGKITVDNLEAKRKKGWIAAVLNLFLPGAGYIYCGKIFIGIIVLPFFILMFFSVGALAPFLIPSLCFVLIVDGFLAADRANKKIDKKIGDLMKKCPQCAEKVLPDAKICKHCGSKLE
ncbi:MAG: zinc ribbon domain-containing protein [Atribacterota bacterium]|nr:zinc ribbon domain-containing protein [Atribacterota bacterium]